LEFVPHAEGFVKWVEGSPQYYFNYTDHLGNVRVTYYDKGDGPIIAEETNYYPFGLQHKGYNEPEQFERNWGNVTTFASSLNNKYKYNGKEFQDELGLNMTAMDMRQYDPVVARWVVQDPIIHFEYSPYNAFDNNPVYWSDPTGEDAQETDAGWAFTGDDAVSVIKLLLNGGGTFQLKGEYSTASGPGEKYLSMDLAAIDFAMQYNGVSIINKVELSSAIYKFNSDGKYSYTKPVGYVDFDEKGKQKPSNNSEMIHDVPAATRLVGHIHTHGHDDGGDIMRFSGAGSDALDTYDNRINAKRYGPEYRAYVAVPDGSLWKYTPWTPGAKTVTDIISKTIPSDSKSMRRNKPYVSPEVTPKIMPTIISSDPNFKLKTKY
jgi:RHS repeat-associated protein